MTVFRDASADMFGQALARGGMERFIWRCMGQRGLEKFVRGQDSLPHLAGKSYVQRFKDEAKVVVRLSHGKPGGCVRCRRVKGEIYLAMEFVEGKDLRAIWNRCAQKGIAFPLPVAATSSRSWCGASPMRTGLRGCAWSTAMYRRPMCCFPIRVRSS